MRIIQIGVVGLLVTTALMSAGCGGGGGGDSSNSGGSGAGGGITANALVGTWKAVSIATKNGQTAPCAANIALQPNVFLSCGSSDTITFAANGTLTSFDSQANQTYTGTWSLSGSTLSAISPATQTAPSETTTDSVAITGTTLTTTQVASSDPDPTLGSDYNGSVVIYQKQ